MTNAEKYKEVFGCELKHNVRCTVKEFGCQLCRDCLKMNCGVSGCKQWLEAEYEEVKDMMLSSI